MAPGSESQAAATDPSCPPFPLLEVDGGGHVHAQEQEQEVPRGAELELPTVDLESPGAACRGLGVFRLANHGFLRVYRYPRCPDPGRRLGMEAHTDSSVLSVINQGDAVGGGLQVLHGGAWRDVAAPGHGESETLLVNLGDMARAISGDAYCSVRHRVAASQAAERLSLCYFAFPRDDAVISCAGGRYRPFTYAEFREQVQADIKATGSKVGLDRFLLRH